MARISKADADRLQAARKAALQIEDKAERERALTTIRDEEHALMGPDEFVEGKRAMYMDDKRAS